MYPRWPRIPRRVAYTRRRVGARRFGLARRIAHVAPPMPELPGVSHSFHEVRGVRLHVAEAGEGEPLVLLHGWPENWWCWRKIIGPLAESGYRVVAPDMRGYGWSDPAPDGYDKESLERDLIALLDALGLDRVQLIGHDWGGWVGFLACLNHPERIE